MGRRRISANGGTIDHAPGSGGAIKLIANQVLGSGALSAIPDGRIRIETSALATDIDLFPETIAVPLTDPPVIFPPANAPTVRIVSVDAITAPDDPTAPLKASADVTIQNNGPVTITLETNNFPIAGVVQLRYVGKFGGDAWLNCTYASGGINSALWTVTHTFTDGFTTLQARATAP